MTKLKTLLFIPLIFAYLVGQGQSSAVTNAWNFLRYKELDKAKEAIDAACKHEGTQDEPKTWLYRGQIYEAIAKTDKAEYKSLSPDAIGEAVLSYQKCIELDPKKKVSDEAANSLQKLVPSIFQDAAGAYNKQDYAAALPGFEKYIKATDVLKKYVNSKVVDTGVIYYTGFSAYSIKDFTKAKMYFNQLINEYKYKESNVYLSMSDIYKAEKDTAKSLEILDKGMVNATDKKNIMIDRLNIFIKQGKSEKAIEEGKKALEIDPNNVSVYLALGTIYQTMGKANDAEDLYKKVIARDPNNFSANNLIGVNYYNLGADLYNKSVDMKDEKKAAKVEEDAKVLWRKAVPFLEKAHEVNAADKETKNLLMELYVKLGDMPKAQQLKNEKY